MSEVQKRCYFVGLNRNHCRNGDNCLYLHDVTYDERDAKKDYKIKKKQYDEEVRRLQYEEEKKRRYEEIKYFKHMQKILRGPCIYYDNPQIGCYKGDDCPFLHATYYIRPPQLITDDQSIPH
jgi:hypothetical protein